MREKAAEREVRTTLGGGVNTKGLPDGASSKKTKNNLPAHTGDVRDAGSITELGRSLKEVTATHSSTLAWRIPWTEEPGRLQSVGLQRFRYERLK